MNCPKCNLKMQKVRENQVFSGNIVVEAVPALKCPGCGEKFFGEKAYDSTLKKVQEVKGKIPLQTLAKIKALFV
ncbi:MAG: YgiT-type zinc finger protein [Candidatus Diapherotrites archaeon]|nr:YgiT-type zinc finger protein [Candidatus Diapherotrites archaeon]